MTMCASDSNALPPNAWTVIALRPRDLIGDQLLEWSPIPGAPIDTWTARELQASGRIVMANRHFDDHVELVVRPAAAGYPENNGA
jgi:hypothetical protein